MSFPDLSKLKDFFEDDQPKRPPPPAPTQGGFDRYFYILHRPADSPDPYPTGVERIVQSGGVGADRSSKTTRGATDDGIDEAVKRYFQHVFNEKTSLSIMSGGLKSSVSWYYLDTTINRESIRMLASDDELVFRVPEDWLRENALSCLEWTLNDNRRSQDGANLRPPWAFLTSLVVPLEYRILSSSPLDDEGARALSNVDVASIIYTAHVAEDPQSRDVKTYNKPEPPPPPLDDGPVEIINPFA